jgi:hypothetical protein
LPLPLHLLSPNLPLLYLHLSHNQCQNQFHNLHHSLLSHQRLIPRVTAITGPMERVLHQLVTDKCRVEIGAIKWKASVQCATENGVLMGLVTLRPRLLQLLRHLRHRQVSPLDMRRLQGTGIAVEERVVVLTLLTENQERKLTAIGKLRNAFRFLLC